MNVEIKEVCKTIKLINKHSLMRFKKKSYLKDNEKLISWLTLHNNLLAIFKLDCLEGISNRQPFPFIQRLCSQDVSMSPLFTSQNLLTGIIKGIVH